MIAALGITGSQEQQVNQASNGGAVNRITQAIQTAAARTGVSFAYLLNKASQESSLDPNAKASTSSATGLFQFTQQTWLQMVKANGAQFGLGQYASQIQVTDGVATVNDPHLKQEILGLRNDPTISAEMAGALDKSNLSALKSSVGGSIGPTELYLAHFLGAGGASEFLNTLKSNPNATAAGVLPEAAEANQSVFYNSNGVPRTVAQVYQHFAQKFDRAPNNSPSTMVATAAPVTPGGYSLAGAKVLAANYSTSVMASDAYNMASLNKGIAATSSQTANGTVSPESPALFATMVLAQMDKESTSTPGVWSSNSNHKKDAGTTTIALDSIA